MEDSVAIIKHQGQRPSETFQRHKLHHSVRAACLSIRSPEGLAESTAKRVCDGVVNWLKTRPEVTSEDLRRIAAAHLEIFQPDAAYFYKQHSLII